MVSVILQSVSAYTYMYSTYVCVYTRIHTYVANRCILRSIRIYSQIIYMYRYSCMDMRENWFTNQLGCAEFNGVR